VGHRRPQQPAEHLLNQPRRPEPFHFEADRNLPRHDLRHPSDHPRDVLQRAYSTRPSGRGCTRRPVSARPRWQAFSTPHSLWFPNRGPTKMFL